MKKFNNRENKNYKVDGGKILWESRSVAVAGTILIKKSDEIFVLAGKRGKAAADNQGKWNLICGYLDWDESADEALEREVWEESGLDMDILKDSLLMDDLKNPWRVHSCPKTSNRQNVTLHYGCLSKVEDFPKLSIENNEVDGETEEVIWMNIDDIYNYEWAFDHDKIIKKYLKFCHQMILKNI